MNFLTSETLSQSPQPTAIEVFEWPKMNSLSSGFHQDFFFFFFLEGGGGEGGKGNKGFA